MKYHMSNPWTSKPTVVIALTPAEVAALRKELDSAFEHFARRGSMEALAELDDLLNKATLTALPDGLLDED